MIDQNKYPEGDDDFDADAFDEADLTEDDLDAEIYDESADDADYVDDDFADEDWQENSPAAPRKDRSGARKGLSLNTIIIIGGFVVGAAVLFMTISSESKKAAQNPGSGGFFQSASNITSMMDGLFSLGSEEATPDVENDQEGFLNNPETAAIEAPPVDGGPDNPLPPQPVPIAPAEPGTPEASPLMPMPGEGAPRGPDEAPEPTPVAEMPAAAPAVSAEDILKQAMANRAQNTPHPATPVEEPVPQAQPAVEPQIQPQPAAQQTPAPVETVTPAPVAPETTQALAANTKAMEAVGAAMEKLVGRMDKVESDIGAVKEASRATEDKFQAVDQALKTLTQNVSDLQKRPVEAVVTPKPAEKQVKKGKTESPLFEDAQPAVEKAEKPAAKAAPQKKAVKKSSPAPQTGTAWELRAAQPGRAWISRAGARDMQTVQVGQPLAGIGTVTGIAYQNGRWVVQGTQGQIRQ